MIQSFRAISIIVLISFLAFSVRAQTFCKPDGNVIIYSNYDGGYLNINVDQDIPNLKIGITTYEDCEVSISGTYVNDVTQVIYAGYQGDNQHCNPSPLTTSVNGVDPGIVSILLYPDANWTNANGYLYIICNYSCDSATNQGGCNTPDQISYYYLTQFSGSLYYHFTQYDCWSGTYNVSSGGNCCIGENLYQNPYSLTADFTATDDTACIKEGISFTNTSTNTYPGAPAYQWDFGDGTTDTSENPSHGYAYTGTYVVTLTITDSSGTASDTQTMIITVINCNATGVNDFAVNDKFLIYPNPTNNVIIFQSTPQHSFDKVELLDVNGEIIFSRKSLDEKNISIDVSSFSPGIYCLRIVNDSEYVLKKVVIE
ncbi:MAG: PKD domain-containing protein [Chitinophagales bacterium]